MVTPVVQIGERRVGPGEPVFVIAEIGVNHNGDVELARSLIDAAVEAGADAVKFQAFKAATLVARGTEKPDYQKVATDAEEPWDALLRRLELGPEDLRGLCDYARDRGITFLCTPFDPVSCELLLALELPAIKVSSGDVNNLPMLRQLAASGRPVILSTGMSTLADVEAAVDIFEAEAPLVLLHCVSDYPTNPADANLRAVDTLRAAFGRPTGFSDHTMGTAIAVAAVARGANVIEKHLTSDRKLPGPDHAASLEPAELRALVAQLHEVESALGDGRKIPTASEVRTRALAAKSLVAARDLATGTRLQIADLTVMRPGNGLAPAQLEQLVGIALARPLQAGEVLTWDHFKPTEAHA